MDIIRQCLAILLVFALLWVALRHMKKQRGDLRTGRVKSGLIQSRAKLALSAQHSLHLIRAGGREVLLGLHPSGFTVVFDCESGREGEPTTT